MPCERRPLPFSHSAVIIPAVLLLVDLPTSLDGIQRLSHHTAKRIKATDLIAHLVPCGIPRHLQGEEMGSLPVVSSRLSRHFLRASIRTCWLGFIDPFSISFLRFEAPENPSKKRD